LEAALEWRRRIFSVAGIAVLVLLGVAQAAAGLIQDKSDPNLLTAGLWIFCSVELVGLSTILLGPRRGLSIRAGAGESGGRADAGKTLSLLAVGLAASPLLIGVVMWVISGDIWRLYVFVPLALTAAAVYWARVGALLETLEAQLGPERGPEPTS
jgi:hypothetical protein